MKRRKIFIISFLVIVLFAVIVIFEAKINKHTQSTFELDKRAEIAWRKLSSVDKPIKGYLYPAKVNNKWGFIDSNGKFKISPQFDYVTLFSISGTAVVGNFNKRKTYISAKIINKKGNTVLNGICLDKYESSFSFPDYNIFFNNYFDTFKMLNNKNVIVNQKGKVIYTTNKKLWGYSEGFVAEGNSAYIDVSKLIEGKKDFKIKLAKKYERLNNFYHSYAELDISDYKSEYINKDGKIFTKKPKDYVDEILDYDDYIDDDFHSDFYTLNNELADDGYKILKKKDGNEKKFGIADIHGNIVLPVKYEEYSNDIKYLGEGMFAIGSLTPSWEKYRKIRCTSIFDAKSRKIYKADYYSIQRYYGGVAAVIDYDLKTSFFIDRHGKKAKGYHVFQQVGPLMKIGGLIMQNVHGKVSYYLKNGTKIYSEKDPIINVNGKIRYASVSTYRRYDFGLAYPRFFGLSSSSAQNRINYSAEKMNKEIFDSIMEDNKIYDYSVSYADLNVSLNKNLLLVKYSASTNGGGTLTIPYIRLNYYDIRNGQSYDLSSMFKKGIEYKKEIVERVFKLYSHKSLLNLLWFKEDKNLNEVKEYLLDGNFYITKHGIVIAEFPDGSSNHLISCQKIMVPYSKLNDIIDTKSELWNSFNKSV